MTYEVGVGLEARLGSLFQLDTLSSAQYLQTFRRKRPLEPEKRLILAVLEEAIACFQKYLFARDTRGKTLFRGAEEWILEEGSGWLFSFENICEALGFNPRYVRRGLMRWKEAKLTGRPKAKIYRWIPREERKKVSVTISQRTGERFSESLRSLDPLQEAKDGS